MHSQKLYLIALSFTYLVTTIGLVAFNEQRIAVYMSLYIIGYFGITALFRSKKKYFDLVGIGLFIIFIYIVVMNVIDYTW